MIAKSKIIESLLHATETYFTEKDIENCMDQFLDEILQLSQSEYGFIGIIEDNGTQKYLRTLAITNIAWNDETRAFYQENIAKGLEFYNLDSLFGEVIKTGTVVISNDPSEDDRACGIPQGHPPLNSFLGVPLRSGADFVGMFGIANCKGGYSSETLKDLQPFSECIATLIANYSLSKETQDLQKDLISEKGFLAKILSNTADGIITINRSGIIQSVNHSALKMFGYEEAELIGQNIKILTPEDHRDKHDSYIQNYHETGYEYVINTIRELTAVKKDGSEIPIELSVSKVDYGSVMFMGIIRDISLREKYISGVEEARIAAEYNNNAKSEFLAIMSHELRTPMNGILGSLQILRDELAGSAQEELLNIAYQSSQNLLHSLNSVVEYSKLISGLSQKEQMDFYIEEVLTIIEQLFAGKALDKGVEFVIDRNGVDHSIFRADEFKIKQILLNLVDNALKFTSEGFVKVSVELKRVDSCYRCKFMVEDTGQGISEAQQEAIFAHFTQENSSMSRNQDGFGLGLSIAREMAHILGGEIEVKSSLGEGSVFTLEIPLALSDKQVYEGVTVTSSKILIVDDNKINQKILHKVLERMSFEADIAQDGFEAVQLFEENHYSLILMDLMMPGMDGYEATEKILAMDPEAKIVAVTANDTVDQMEKCLKIGMKDFISKPVNIKKIKAILKEL